MSGVSCTANGGAPQRARSTGQPARAHHTSGSSDTDRIEEVLPVYESIPRQQRVIYPVINRVTEVPIPEAIHPRDQIDKIKDLSHLRFCTI